MPRPPSLTANRSAEREPVLVSGHPSGVNQGSLSEPGWSAFLKSQPHASVFHGSEWAAVLNKTYGFEPHYLVKRSGGEITAALPLMEVNSWLTGRRGVSLPFTDDCELLGENAGEVAALILDALEMGRSRGWKYLEFRGGRGHFQDAKPSVTFYGHEIDLAAGETALFERLESSVRRSIRKSEKSGLKIEFLNTLESVKAFYSLLCLTRQRHGMPPQPFRFFENIHGEIISKGMGTVVLASLEGRAVAGAVYLGQGRRAVYKFGASDEKYQELRGNNLVMWNALKWHAAKGFKTLHMGRTSLSNEGLRRFKLGWGAVENTIEYFKHDFGSGEFVSDKDEASGWHNKVFRAMPLGMARLVGAGLYRHWA